MSDLTLKDLQRFAPHFPPGTAIRVDLGDRMAYRRLGSTGLGAAAVAETVAETLALCVQAQASADNSRVGLRNGWLRYVEVFLRSGASFQLTTWEGGSHHDVNVDTDASVAELRELADLLDLLATLRSSR